MIPWKFGYRQLVLLVLVTIIFKPNNASRENEEGYIPSSESEESTERNTSIDENYSEVNINQGKVRGSTYRTRKNRTFAGFIGIPFAQPPVGTLRFRAPLPADPWNGTLNAYDKSYDCPQFRNGSIIGDEDCLYVNIYTPKLPNISKSQNLLPVMVFIHGGGFYQGGDDFDMYGPTYLLDQDMLLVVPNYRLGILGFLSTGDEESPGNYGLKDQILALEWVQKNVEYFGGDPRRVTLVGQSAGGVSVNFLALSNKTEGLFHQYASMSGPAFSKFFSPSEVIAVERAFTLGKYLKCPTATSIELIECLRMVNTSTLLSVSAPFTFYGISPVILWGPVAEPDIDGAVITKRPEKLITEGRIRDQSRIMGHVTDEGLLITQDYYMSEDNLNYFISKFDEILPYLLNYKHIDENKIKSCTAAIKECYFGRNQLTGIDSAVIRSGLTEISGDRFFVYPIAKQIREEIPFAKWPKYIYVFAYRGTFSLTQQRSKSLDTYGVSHADDLLYLFDQIQKRFGFLGKKMSETDLEMVDTMVQLWGSFVINGKPTASSFTDSESWQPYSLNYDHLQIGNGSETKLISIKESDSNFVKRYEFWEEFDTVCS